MTTTTTLQIASNGTVEFCDTTRDEDGNVIDENWRCFVPGQDVSSQPQEVRDACYAAWTPEVVTAYQAILPPPPVVSPKAQITDISDQLVASGIFKPMTYMLIDYYIQRLKQLFPTETDGKTDAQVAAMLSDTGSAYYDADFVRVQTYNARLMVV